MRPFTMLINVIALTAIAATPLDGQSRSTSPTSEKETLIRRILEVSKAADNMLVTMEAALPAQRASNPAIPAVFWDRFIARARADRAVFIDSLVPIYEKHFSAADLREMLRFYETPAGRRMLAVMPDIMRESIAAGQRWGFVIGQEIGEQLAREGLVPRQPD